MKHIFYFSWLSLLISSCLIFSFCLKKAPPWALPSLSHDRNNATVTNPFTKFVPGQQQQIERTLSGGRGERFSQTDCFEGPRFDRKIQTNTFVGMAHETEAMACGSLYDPRSVQGPLAQFMAWGPGGQVQIFLFSFFVLSSGIQPFMVTVGNSISSSAFCCLN